MRVLEKNEVNSIAGGVGKDKMNKISGGNTVIFDPEGSKPFYLEVRLRGDVNYCMNKFRR